MGLIYGNPFEGRPHTSFKRPTERYDGDAPNSEGFTINESWGALKRCWRGYRIAKREGDEGRMLLYARRIRKLQFELGVSICEFPNLGLEGTSPDNVDLMAD